MSAIDWNDIALRCGPSIGSQRRGVLNISSLGFFVVFVPNTERARFERDLALAGFPIHGIAQYTNEDGEGIFVAVVTADSLEKLRAIVYGKVSRETKAATS